MDWLEQFPFSHILVDANKTGMLRKLLQIALGEAGSRDPVLLRGFWLPITLSNKGRGVSSVNRAGKQYLGNVICMRMLMASRVVTALNCWNGLERASNLHASLLF